MLGVILRECIGGEALTQEVHRLVCLHEVGGDLRSDLLKDADSLSYFDVNLPRYFERGGLAGHATALRMRLPAPYAAGELDRGGPEV